MAELTKIDTKLAEVLGLAQAAQKVTEKVGGLVEQEEISQKIQQIHDEAAELEQRCTECVESLEGKKTAILDKARETKGEATEMMNTYLGSDADGLDGLEFMTMAEAAEYGHWGVLREMNQKARIPGVEDLVNWALPIEERHFETVKSASLQVAAEEDPNETEG